MAESSIFESRRGLLKCSQEGAFNFISDMRNFRQFIPANSVTELILEKDSCSFRVDMLGNVNLGVSEKTEFNRVVYSGTVPQVKDFSVTVEIAGKGLVSSEAIIIVRAEINTFLKMLAAGPVDRALEEIIKGMENFSGW